MNGDEATDTAMIGDAPDGAIDADSHDLEDDGVTCPECGEDFGHRGPQAKLLRGLHRKREHGVRGSGGHSAKAPRTPKAPRPTAAGPRPTARGGRVASRKDLEDGVREMYESVGLVALMRGDEEAARMIIGNKRFEEMVNAEPTNDGLAGAAAKAWAKLAQHNQTVETALGKTLSTGDWAEVMGAHLPLLVLTVKRRPQAVASIGQTVLGGLRRRFRQGRPTAPAPAARRPPQAAQQPTPPHGYGAPPNMSGPRVVPS